MAPTPALSARCWLPRAKSSRHLITSRRSCAAATPRITEYSDTAERAALARTYDWYTAFLAAVERVLEARVALVDAERALQHVGNDPKVWRVQFDTMTDSNIDRELLARVPRGQGQIAEARVGHDVVLRSHADTGFLTVDGCRELVAKAEQLAAAVRA